MLTPASSVSDDRPNSFPGDEFFVDPIGNTMDVVPVQNRVATILRRGLKGAEYIFGLYPDPIFGIPAFNIVACCIPWIGNMCLAASAAALPRFLPEDVGDAFSVVGSGIANLGLFVTLSVAYSSGRMVKAHDIINNKPWPQYAIYQIFRLYLWANYISCIFVQAELTGQEPPHWFPELNGFKSSFFYGAGGAAIIVSRLHAPANIVLALEGSERKEQQRNNPQIKDLLYWINVILMMAFVICDGITWLGMYSPKFVDVFNPSLPWGDRALGAAFTVITPITFYFASEDYLFHTLAFLQVSNSYLRRSDYKLPSRIVLITLEVGFMAFVALCSISGLISDTSREDAPYVTTFITMYINNFTSMPKAFLTYRQNRITSSVPNSRTRLLHSSSQSSIQNGQTPPTAGASTSAWDYVTAPFTSCYNFFRNCCGSRPPRSETYRNGMTSANGARLV